jgi:hypothetical protein
MGKARKAQAETPTITTIGAFKLTASGLKVEGVPTFRQWEEAVIEAKALGVCLMWVIGDLLVYGEEKYGEEYAQALEAADYADETVRQAQWVAKQFPPSIRLSIVPFSFHRTVATLPQKQALGLLKKAGLEGWTRQVLALEVRKLKTPEKPAEEPVTRVTESEESDPDDTPLEVSGDPVKCLEAVAGMSKALKKWRALFSSIMASPFSAFVGNVAGGYTGCEPYKTGERVESGKLGPITFGPAEYSTEALDELLNFGGGLTAMLNRVSRPEVPGAGVGEWEVPD